MQVRGTVGQKPVKAAKTLGMFGPPESLNSARIESMTPSMACSENKEAIDGVIRSIQALFTDSGGPNMPRVLAAFTGFWPTVRPSQMACRSVATKRRTAGQETVVRRVSKTKVWTRIISPEFLYSNISIPHEGIPLRTRYSLAVRSLGI